MSTAANTGLAGPATLARPPWAAAYIAALGEYGVPTQARKQAGASRREVCQLEESDPGFAIECRDAVDDHNDELDSIAIRLAKGTATDLDRKYDPAMLRFLLKGRKPEIYGMKGKAGVRATREAFLINDVDPPLVERGRVP